MNICMSILSGLIIITSIGFGGYLDRYRNVDSPPLFWLLGFLGGFLSVAIMVLI